MRDAQDWKTLCATTTTKQSRFDHGCNKTSPRWAILQVNPETAGRPDKLFPNVNHGKGQIISVLFY